MTERNKLDLALTKIPGGLPAGAFTAKERAIVTAVLARRFPGFVLAAGRSKAQTVGDLAAHLLARQGRSR
jgi:hypothetical protein